MKSLLAWQRVAAAIIGAMLIAVIVTWRKEQHFSDLLVAMLGGLLGAAFAWAMLKLVGREA